MTFSRSRHKKVNIVVKQAEAQLSFPWRKSQMFPSIGRVHLELHMSIRRRAKWVFKDLRLRMKTSLAQYTLIISPASFNAERSEWLYETSQFFQWRDPYISAWEWIRSWHSTLKFSHSNSTGKEVNKPLNLAHRGMQMPNPWTKEWTSPRAEKIRGFLCRFNAEWSEFLVSREWMCSCDTWRVSGVNSS